MVNGTRLIITLYHHPNDTFSLILFSHFLILRNHKAIVGLKNLKPPVVIGFSWSEFKNSLEDKWHSNSRNQVNRHVNLTESGRQLHRSCYLYTKSHFSVFDIQRRWEQSDEVNISRTSHYEDRCRDRTAPSTEKCPLFESSSLKKIQRVWIIYMIDLSFFSSFCPAMNFFMEEPIDIKFVIEMENVSSRMRTLILIVVEKNRTVSLGTKCDSCCFRILLLKLLWRWLTTEQISSSI